MVEEQTTDTINFDTVLQTPRLIAFLFADSHEIQADNKVSLSGIFHAVEVPTNEPRTPFDISVFMRIAQATEEPIYVHFYTPEHELVEVMELVPPKDFVLDDDQPNYVQVARTFTFMFHDLGLYWFDVRYQGQSLGMVPLFVKAQV